VSLLTVNGELGEQRMTVPSLLLPINAYALVITHK
jgi:hypothetical protein